MISATSFFTFNLSRKVSLLDNLSVDVNSSDAVLGMEGGGGGGPLGGRTNLEELDSAGGAGAGELGRSEIGLVESPVATVGVCFGGFGDF